MENTLDVLSIFKKCDAFKEHGHYEYTPKEDGKIYHGDTYVAKEMLYAYPNVMAQLCEELARNSLTKFVSECVVGPERGGIILSQWTAYFLGKLTNRQVISIYAQKITPPPKKGLKFTFKPEYGDLVAGKDVFITEDVINSGGTVKEVASLVRAYGGSVAGVGALWNRGGATADDIGCVPKLFSLLNIELPRYPATQCPLCAKGVRLNIEYGHAQEFSNDKG